MKPEQIKEIVASHLGIEMKDLMGKRRLKEYVLARNISMWLFTKYTPLTYPSIGRHFKKDRTMVYHSIDRIKYELERETKTSRMIKEIEDEVNEKTIQKYSYNFA